MSARARGDHEFRRRRAWRPVSALPSQGPKRNRPQKQMRTPAADPDEGQASQLSARARRTWLVIAIVAVAATATGYSSTMHRDGAHNPPVIYPTTPREWFDAYMAAAVDDPARVCAVLFSPELAASYRHTSSGSCLRYFRDAQDTAVRIDRVVYADSTAVVEVRQVVAPRYRWTVVLSRHDGGWQAVTLQRAA